MGCTCQIVVMTNFILDGTKQAGFLFRSLTTLVEDGDDLHASGGLVVEGCSVADASPGSTSGSTSEHVGDVVGRTRRR